MKTILFVFLLFLSTSSFAQEHAPTAAQCQADERLWSSESVHATDGTGFDLTIRRYSLNELIARSKEMMACISIDPSRGKYESTSMLILSQIERRLTRYVQETGQAEKYDAWERAQAGR